MADSAAPPSSLPDERRLWQFLEGVKGWRFTGAGYMVCGPGDGGNPMESAQVCKLATAVAVDEFGVALVLRLTLGKECKCMSRIPYVVVPCFKCGVSLPGPLAVFGLCGLSGALLKMAPAV